MFKIFYRHKDFWLFFVVAFIVALIIFGPTLRGKFTLDDHPVIESRMESFTIVNFPRLFLASWHPAGEWAGNYRPLTLWSLALNAIISQKPFGFHLVNIFIQALNSALIFALVRRISSRRAAIWAGLLFLVLPIHTEAVASVVGRVYLQGTFFSLLTLLYFLEKKYIWSTIWLLAALFSGDFFISMVPILGVLLWGEEKSLWKALKKSWRYGAATGLYFLFRYLALGSRYVFGGEGFVDPIIGPLAYVGAKERVFTALTHLYFYLRKTFFPIDLSPDYSFNQIPTVSSLFLAWRSWVGIIFLGGIFFLGVWKRVSRPAKMAVGGFAISYALMSNIFIVTTGTMAERWWYWPSLGLVILMALGWEAAVSRLRADKKWVYVLSAMVMIWYSWVDFQQSHVWFDDRHLFARAVEKSPGSVWARTNLAEEYFASRQYPAAREEIKLAMAIAENNPLTLYVRGKINWQENKINEAEEAFLRAVQYDAHDRNKRSLYRTLALLSLDMGDNKKALVYMREAIKWPPAGQRENILKIDEYLLGLTREYASRRPASYSAEEQNKLARMIKALRGF